MRSGGGQRRIRSYHPTVLGGGGGAAPTFGPMLFAARCAHHLAATHVRTATTDASLAFATLVAGSLAARATCQAAGCVPGTCAIYEDELGHHELSLHREIGEIGGRCSQKW